VFVLRPDCKQMSFASMSVMRNLSTINLGIAAGNSRRDSNDEIRSFHV
jgi:hypothetical protein